MYMYRPSLKTTLTPFFVFDYYIGLNHFVYHNVLSHPRSHLGLTGLPFPTRLFWTGIPGVLSKIIVKKITIIPLGP